MASSNQSYLIIGAGVFGASTAYHLIKKYPSASITLVDRDHYDADTRVAASWDWNKVVRADYDDIIYCRLALEAQDIFRNDELWKPYFKQSGIYWMCRNDYANEVIANYRKLGRKAELKAVPVEEARKLYGGIFETSDYSGVKEVLVNRTSGWAAAGDCLQAVTREAVRLGVKYVTAEVSTLQFSGDRCTGVKTSGGQVVEAKQVLVCAGAYTPKLLELSAQATGRPELAAEERIVAGGITTGLTAPLRGQDWEDFREMPVGVQGYTATIGPFIGSLPPTKDRELKWWGQTIFKNTHQVLADTKPISAPPAEKDYAQWKVPRKLKADIDHANHVFYGQRGAAWKMEKYRICWDAFTTTSDFVISPHTSSGVSNLYIAACGSFHGWKFFPVLGKYIVQMLEGELEPELVAKWAWDRERPDPIAAGNADWPRHEMNRVLEGVEDERAARL